MNISFEYYRIFYYVAKYENITKAAMVLKSSQPNVTRIIHLLEDQLDCRLFLREPRGLKLTEEGKRLYDHVAIACQHLLDAEAELCWNKNICSGTIELGVTETALHLFLLKHLHGFQQKYSDIKIRIQNNTTPGILKALLNGRLDLAIVTTPFELNDTFACEDLMTFREVPAGGSEYRALAGHPMSLKEFRFHSIIGLGYGTASYEYYRKVFMEQKLDYEPAMEVATADLVIPLLQKTLHRRETGSSCGNSQRKRYCEISKSNREAVAHTVAEDFSAEFIIHVNDSSSFCKTPFWRTCPIITHISTGEKEEN